MMPWSRMLWMLLLSLLLTACTVLPEPRSHDVWRLPPSTLLPGDGATTMQALRIAGPASQDLLAGSRIVVLSDDHRFNVYDGARWSAPVPILWRDHLLDAFHRDGRVGRLGSDSDMLAADFELGGLLRAFQAERHDDGLRVVIRLDAHLAEVRSRRLLASRRFEHAVDVDGRDLAAIVVAFGRVADAVAAEIIEWTLQETANHDE